MRLTTSDHDRRAGGLTYVYPVVSRRARGVSVGINLNPNNACNWRCVYCQVPGLVHGKGPPIDLDLLRRELHAMLDDIANGDFMETRVPEGSRRLNDIALSGNGEPTGSPDFGAAVDLALAVRGELGLDEVKLLVITNGSLVREPAVATALERLGAANGEVWFKLDAATDEGMQRVNSSALGVERQLESLRRCAGLAPTWVQTCLFRRGGEDPPADELEAYLDALRGLREQRVPLRGVLLYGLARESHQPEAPELSALEPAWLEAFGARIEALGLSVRVHP